MDRADLREWDLSGQSLIWPATFLADTVRQRLQTTADVLALGEIRQTMQQELAAALAAGNHPSSSELSLERLLEPRWLLGSFFFGLTKPYFPVEVTEQIAPGTAPRHWPDLTCLLADPPPGGMLLQGRSGSGKTLAMLAAALTCLNCPARLDGPPADLASRGYLPCWLEPQALPEEREGLTLLHDLLMRQALPQCKLPNRVIGVWLENGPDLLLLADLNAWGPERDRVAHALNEFQRQALKNGRGHRVVAAYRSAMSDDGTMRALCAKSEGEDQPPLRPYELMPLPAWQAETYLKTLPRYRDSVRVYLNNQRALKEAGVALTMEPEEPAGNEADRRLVQRLSSGRESLVSTPLLLHFVTMIPPAKRAAIDTLNDLYDEVVKQYLDRELPRVPPELGNRRQVERVLLSLLTRLSLAILGQGSGDTTLKHTELEDVILRCGACSSGWRPPAELWEPELSPYYDDDTLLEEDPIAAGNATTQKERRALMKKWLGVLTSLGPLRRSGEAVGMVHDSLLYYFAGRYGLRYYQEPEQPSRLPEAWFAAAAGRMAAAPQRWRWPAEFLGGLLSAVERRKLLGEMLIVQPTPAGLPEVCRQMLEAGSGTDEVLGPVQRFLDREAHRLESDPRRLFQELWNELVPGSESAVAGYLKELDRRRVRVEWEFRRKWPMQKPRLEIRRFEGHTQPVRVSRRGTTGESRPDAVNWACFSPDGRQVLSASMDGTIRLWDVYSGQQLHEFEGRGKRAYFSPDGQHVLTASNQTVCLWDVHSGKQLQQFEGYFSPDGQVFSLLGGKSVRLWDVDSGRQLQQFTGHTGEVKSVRFLFEGVKWACFSPDGQRVLTASCEPVRQWTVRLWDVYSGKQLQQFAGHTDEVKWASFSPDRQHVLTRSDDRTIRLWDAHTGVEICRFEGLERARFSPDGQHVLIASSEIVRLWDVYRREQIWQFDGFLGPVSSARFSPDGQQVLIASWSIVRVWDVSGKPLQQFEGHTDHVKSACFSPDGQQVLSASWDATVRLWDVHNGNQLQQFAGHTDEVKSVCFSPDSQQVLSASSESVRLWDVHSGKQIQRFEGHVREVDSACFSPDGQQVLSSSWGKTVLLWDVHSGKQVQEFEGYTGGARWTHIPSYSQRALSVSVAKGHTGGATWAYFSPHGRQLLIALCEYKVRLWDVHTGKQVQRFEGHTAVVTSACFSSDGQQVLSASMDKTVRLWDVHSGKQIQRFEGHVRGVDSACFSPDGQQVLSASRDGTVRLWDTYSGEVLHKFYGHADGLNWACFSFDNRQVLGASSDGAYGAVCLWSIERKQPAAWTPDAVAWVDGACLAVAVTQWLDPTTGENCLLVVAGDGSAQVSLWHLLPPQPTAPSNVQPPDPV